MATEAQTPTSQSGKDIRAKVQQYRRAHEAEIVRAFAEMLAIPNVASDKANIRSNAEYIARQFGARGARMQLLDTPGAPPIVFGELTAPKAAHTFIFYAHYDGQPVDASQWASPPWHPVLRDKRMEDGGKEIPLDTLTETLNPEWRIYARSAGDDKTPIQALLTALDALKAAGIPPSVNVKFFFEGEEEAGSPHLAEAIERYRPLLKADAWILCDGPVHQTRRMQVFFGARGVTDMEMTLYGPTRSLHSGHYGNWAPNPAAEIVHLIASMRDENARILIPNFYDDVKTVTVAEQQALREMPEVDQQLKRELGLAATEGDGKRVGEAIMQPSLNVRGIESGHVGEQAQNAIPTQARASFDIRLVPNQSPQRVQEMVENFIRAKGYFIVRSEPDMPTRLAHPRIVRMNWGSGYPAARTSMELPVSRVVIAAVSEAAGSPAVVVPMLGGSLPMYLFAETLKTPVIGVPIANHDNNQHAANENLRLQNLWDGINVFAGLLAETPQSW